MKKLYTSPQVDTLLFSVEEAACVITASTTETEGFTPIPGAWDNPSI